MPLTIDKVIAASMIDKVCKSIITDKSNRGSCHKVNYTLCMNVI